MFGSSGVRDDIALVQHQVAQLEETLIDMARLLTRLDAAVVVRDPGNARSAEVFEGLRRTLVQLSTQTRTHASHLVGLYELLEETDSVAAIKGRLEDCLQDIGVSKITDSDDADLFETLQSDSDLPAPAWIQVRSDGGHTVLRRGKRWPTPQPEIVEEVLPEILEDDAAISAVEVATSEQAQAMVDEGSEDKEQ